VGLVLPRRSSEKHLLLRAITGRKYGKSHSAIRARRPNTFNLLLMTKTGPVGINNGLYKPIDATCGCLAQVA